MNRHIYSVGQINEYIRNMFRQDYALRRLSCRGEVSNCKYHGSGHIYFTLKDETSQISCVMFSGKRSAGLKFRMNDGDQVVVTGSVEVYARDGRYQLYAENIERAGAGALYEQYLALKNRLEKEGLFAPEHKKPIPLHASVVGIVTAPAGAAVRDIIRNAKKRNPYVQLYLYPALVQGSGAAETIVKGIEMLDAIGCDVIITGRGGGSIEDLWAFNEEAVARAIYNCSAPVISAVGHETDTTIADLAADLRVATPTEAAVRAVEDIRDTFRRISDYRRQLNALMDRAGVYRREQLNTRYRALKALGPSSLIREKRQRLEDLGIRIENGEKHIIRARMDSWNVYHKSLKSSMDRLLEDCEHRSAILAGRLDGVSPVRKLSQGYSYTENTAGHNVSSVSDVKPGDAIRTQVRDGMIMSMVTETCMRGQVKRQQRGLN